MKVIVFDTETNGLVKNKEATVFQTDLWPHILQLSYIVYDTEKQQVIAYSDELIKVDAEHVLITPENQAIHGISMTDCQARGIPIKDALTAFNNHLLVCEMFVGHNVSFDKNIMMVECIRHGLIHRFKNHATGKPRLEYCTMRKSTALCALPLPPRADGTVAPYFKFPKLIELYQKCFQETPGGLHNAMVDVLACLRCFVFLYSGSSSIDLHKTDCPVFHELFQKYCAK